MNPILKIFNLLSSKEKKRAGILMILILIMSVFDMLGIVSIYPFLVILTNPELIQTNKILRTLFEISNSYGVKNPNDFIFVIGILVFLVFTFSLAFKGITNYFLLRFVMMREYSIGRRLVEAYLAQPYTWFLNKHSADLGKNILSEVNNVTDRVLAPFINLIAQCAIIILILLILLFINAKIALISFFGFGTGYFIIYLVVNKKLKNIGISNVQRNKERALVLLETFGAIKEVKMGGLEKVFMKRYDLPAVLYAKGYSLATILSLIPRFAMEGLGFGSMLIVILYLMTILDNFSIIIPILSIYAVAAYRILPAIQQLYTSISTIKYSQPAIDLLYADMNNMIIKNDVVHENDQDEIQLKKEIKLNNLNYKYPASNKFIFKNLNISIKANTSVAFVGKTGSGKTTLIDLIIGLLEPYESKLIVDDKEINNSNVRNWQKLIGYVPQQVYLADDTITNNIAFGVNKENINMKKVEQVAKVANIYDFIINELSNGFETPVGERGVRLSGGQKQRIGIARSLYFSPKVLVLDEATSALDSITERLVMQGLKNISDEMTIITIAHRINTVKNCDIIYLLEKGLIADFGSYDELSIRNDYFKELS
ncbi:ABC transporter ATP-binding protein [Candidatus Pelagibacter sp. HIMB1593]|uniref:ABC transporter ATP-binding protein n=1 Tax=Candidatus Pelagibacter sp. HIMB1593 TaxID=3413355 RepID=UPI003F85A293